MIKNFFRFIGKLILWLFLFSLFIVLLFKWIPIPMTPLMVIRSFEQWQDNKEITWKHDWVSIDNISKNLQLAVICSEDQNFVKHNGFDVKAIEKAMEHNKKSKRTRGA